MDGMEKISNGGFSENLENPPSPLHKGGVQLPLLKGAGGICFSVPLSHRGAGRGPPLIKVR